MKTNQRCLLATWTNEPFQPVRLYYSIPDRSWVTEKLHRLKCTIEVPRERCWQWLFDAEAASLRFAGGYDDVPKERRPIVLGRIRFSEDGGMTLQTNSILRAIEGARFFGPRLGPEVVAMRCRLVNRCFAADEGRPDELMNTLDRDVTVIDPRAGEAAFRREFAGLRTTEDPGRAFSESLKRRIESNEDVPMVEDFPLAPEEETAEFQHLATTLQLRLIRAVEHWQGNTHLTLTAIIVRTIEQNTRARDERCRGSSTSESREGGMYKSIPSEYRGWWRIVETSQWVNDGLDILGPALISLTGYADRLRMHALLAYVNCRPTKTGVSFTWEGAWEYDQVSGYGRVTLGKDGRLKGVIRIKDGDSSTFIAERANEPEDPIPAPPSYRDKWRRRW